MEAFTYIVCSVYILAIKQSKIVGVLSKFTHSDYCILIFEEIELLLKISDESTGSRLLPSQFI